MVKIDAYPTSPAAVIRCGGEDHVDFLHNQGTADLRGPAGLCRYSLFLDHKGSVHADAFVLRLSEEATLLVSYECPAARLIERFERHIIADDVQLADETGSWRLLSLPVSAAAALLDARAARPDAHRFVSEADGYLFGGRRLGRGSLEYLVPETASPPVEVQPIVPAAAENQRIRSGIPEVWRDVAPAGLNPVEAGLASAVSFDKGCYLGQEVVARAHRLQRATRRLAVFTSLAPAPCAPGDLVDDGTGVGRLSSVVESADNSAAIGWLKSRYADGAHCFNGIGWQVTTLTA
jgi:folate-binding protein YgfZ